MWMDDSKTKWHHKINEQMKVWIDKEITQQRMIDRRMDVNNWMTNQQKRRESTILAVAMETIVILTLKLQVVSPVSVEFPTSSAACLLSTLAHWYQVEQVGGRNYEPSLPPVPSLVLHIRSKTSDIRLSFNKDVTLAESLWVSQVVVHLVEGQLTVTARQRMPLW